MSSVSMTSREDCVARDSGDPLRSFRDRFVIPDGIIYLVTGGGGAGLYDADQESKPESWQNFTVKFMSSRHSLTVVNVDGRKLTVRQIAENGNEVDQFVVTKDAAK